MNLFDRALSLVRYFREVRGLLGEIITAEEARRIVEDQFANREDSFLRIMEDVIYASPENPYHRLLEHAGIKLNDVKRLVAGIGLEATLGQLHDAGVYVTQDEFKGRRPIRRTGLEFTVHASDFDYPLDEESTIEGWTSGSTGAPLRLSSSVSKYEYRAAELVFLDSVHPEYRSIGVWQATGRNSLLINARLGRPIEKLFTTVGFRRSWEGSRAAIIAMLTHLATRLAGHSVPKPQFVPNESAIKIARWLAKKTAQGAPALFRCHPSQAMTICLVAKGSGLQIRGTLFQMGGEPFTAARAAVLESVGAKAVVRYVSRETSLGGVSCGTPEDVDDMHLLPPRLALVCRDHEVWDGETVNALILTTLKRDAKIVLNLHTGDYGVVTERECGCPLGQMGFKTHISNIRSYEKLTSGGVTFIGSQLHDLIEDVLPARFGGHLNDYQLVEEEAEDGSPRVSIIVSPSVGPIDENAVVATVLETLERRHAGAGGELMTSHWRQGQMLSILRREPYRTRTEKVAPLHFLTQAPRRSNVEEPEGIGVS